MNSQLIIDDYSDNGSSCNTSFKRKRLMRNGSCLGSNSRSVRSKNSKLEIKGGNRVQIIQDFETYSDESIGEYSVDGVSTINKEIMLKEHEALQKKRMNNVYDIVGILDKGNEQMLAKIETTIQGIWKQLQNQGRTSLRKVDHIYNLKSAKTQEMYSDNIKYYTNKSLKEVLMVIFRGFVYLLSYQNDVYSPVIKPINILDDIGKIVYSELFEKYLAFKIRDMKKQDNKFDHLILVLNDRELFADFVIDFADREEDEIIFESN